MVDLFLKESHYAALPLTIDWPQDRVRTGFKLIAITSFCLEHWDWRSLPLHCPPSLFFSLSLSELGYGAW